MVMVASISKNFPGSCKLSSSNSNVVDQLLRHLHLRLPRGEEDAHIQNIMVPKVSEGNNNGGKGLLKPSIAREVH